MWADVSLTACFLPWLRGRLKDVSHICIFRLFNSVPLSPSLALPGWLFGPAWRTVAGKPEHYHQLRAGRSQHPSLAPGTSLASGRALGKHTFPATDGPWKPYRWLHLSQLFPSVWHSAEASLTATPLCLWSQLCSAKALDKTGWQIRVSGSLQPLGCPGHQRKGVSCQAEVFRAWCRMVEFGQGGS